MTAHASSSIMIPAKVSCPQYWKKEYDGFQTCGAHFQGHTSTEFLCMDNNPEYLTERARQHNNDGRLFYSVEAKCGSLPCPPYKVLSFSHVSSELCRLTKFGIKIELYIIPTLYEKLIHFFFQKYIEYTETKPVLVLSAV